MIGSILAAMSRLVSSILWKAIRSGALGLVIGIVAIEILAALLNKAAGAHGFVTFHIWPPVFNTDVFTEFVHITAVLFGLVLAIAVALAVVLAEAVRTLLLVASHVDDSAQVVLNRIIGTTPPAVGPTMRADRPPAIREPDR